MVRSVFSRTDVAKLELCHPSLQLVLRRARAKAEFRILDTVRGKRAQEIAFRTKRSKAKWGQSPHNFVPCLAVDLFPAPYEWSNKQSFVDLAEIVLGEAQDEGVALRWLGDPNRDGNTVDGWDFPHFELLSWKLIAHRECRLAD